MENYGTHHVNDGNHLVDWDSNGKDKYGGVPLPCLINGGRVFEYINIYTHTYIYIHISHGNMNGNAIWISVYWELERERERKRERDRYIYTHIYTLYIERENLYNLSP